MSNPYNREKFDSIKDIVGDLLRYDSETGDLFWKVNRTNRVFAGDIAGRVHALGYKTVTIMGKFFYAHQIAWLLHYGELPDGEIDHINRVRHDNRLCNLREVSTSENVANGNMRRNNKSGYRGVFWRSQVQKWQAKIDCNGRRYHLGTFNTAKEAFVAYQNAFNKFFKRIAVTDALGSKLND